MKKEEFVVYKKKKKRRICGCLINQILYSIYGFVTFQRYGSVVLTCKKVKIPTTLTWEHTKVYRLFENQSQTMSFRDNPHVTPTIK